MIIDKFGKKKLKLDINPDEAIAYGAAIVASIIEVQIIIHPNLSKV